MRLFAAVDLSPDAEASLAAIVPIDPRMRYVPAEQWHITVAFYGDVADAAAVELAERLSRAAARTPAFRLSVRGAGTFPTRSQRARVLWCGLSGDIATLSRVADRAAAAGRRCGVRVDERGFRPHLTLARCRGEPFDMSDSVDALSGYAGPEWTADELHLVRSNLGPPTRHERLATWPLGPR